MKIKKSTLAVIICAILSGIAFIISILLSSYNLQKNWILVGSRADYKSNKFDFETVVDWISERYGGQDVMLPIIVIDYEKGAIRLGDDEIPAEISDALKNVDRAFTKDAYLVYIGVKGKQISFCTHGREYALVYSPDGAPKRVYNRSGRIFREKLGGGWYHVAEE